MVNNTETPEITRAMEWAQAKNIPLRRPSPYQLKVGRLNYWPTKGTLIFDGERAMPRRGFEAFKQLVEKMTDL
jgi:hypothetical protein